MMETNFIFGPCIMRKYLKLSVFLAILTLGGCSYFHVYKLDNEQGNIITSGMLQQIKLGMSKEQVQYIMGDSILQNPFTADHWDYVYYFQAAYGPLSTKKISFIFKNDKLIQIIGPMETGPQDSSLQKAADLSEELYPQSPWQQNNYSAHSLPVPFSNEDGN